MRWDCGLVAYPNPVYSDLLRVPLSTYTSSRAVFVIHVWRALGLIDVRVQTRACLIYTNQILAARRSVPHEAMRWQVRRHARSTSPSGGGGGGGTNYFHLFCVFYIPSIHLPTYLHSYSVPLMEMIVVEYRSSSPWCAGCRSPFLHCNVPQRTFSCAHLMYSVLLTMPQWPLIDPFILNCSEHSRSAAVPPYPQTSSHCTVGVGQWPSKQYPVGSCVACSCPQGYPFL